MDALLLLWEDESPCQCTSSFALSKQLLFSCHDNLIGFRKTGFGAHPAASYPMGTGVKWPGAKLTTHFHLVPRSRMHGTIPPLPHKPSWHGT